MPRGRKSYTLEERLQNVTNEIDELEARIKELKKEKKELEEQAKIDRLTKLDELITGMGLSLDDVEKKLSE